MAIKTAVKIINNRREKCSHYDPRLLSEFNISDEFILFGDEPVVLTSQTLNSYLFLSI